jgi:putative transcriptional regulator
MLCYLTSVNEMTQEQLPKKAGVTRQTITAIESAKYSPSLELAFRIALVFDLPLEEVFSYSTEDVPANPP